MTVRQSLPALSGNSVIPRNQNSSDSAAVQTPPSKSSPAHDHEETSPEDLKQREVAHRASPSGEIVYGAVLKEAGEELSRATSALFWSGFAAGLAMGLSLAGEGLIRHCLPNAIWAPLISKLGYSFGFVVVILGRQQLFTENTLTPILPLLKNKDVKTLLNVLRLWSVVLVSNLAGALLVSFAAMHTDAFEKPVRQEFIAMGQEAMQHDFLTLLIRAIFAGWLVAILVWMLPYAESAHFFVIIMITWLIGVGHFSHIIAGSVEVFAVGWTGMTRWPTIFVHYVVPVLLGNILGGVTLVAALNHAQINSGES
jgi:formate/nitrite transporter FocA (FNT family)